jgi:hypothetical protein
MHKLLARLNGLDQENLYTRLAEEVRNPRVRAQAQAIVLQRSRDHQAASLYTGPRSLHADWPDKFDRSSLMTLLASAAWWIESHGRTCTDEVVDSIFDALTWWP